MAFLNFLFGDEKSNNTSKIIDKDILLKRERLIELKEILCNYADKVYHKWSSSKLVEEREQLIEASFGLNRFLYELDSDIQSKTYSEGIIEECEDFEKQLRAII